MNSKASFRIIFMSARLHASRTRQKKNNDMPVIIDQKKINELLTRGVEHVYPSKEFLEKELVGGRQLSLYTGYDPTAPTLHIGHGITLLKLRQFQDLGHKVIFLIGDFTGMIGDPTDKMAARKKLTREEVRKNCAIYEEQAATILDFDGDNPVEIRFNSTWSDPLTFADVLEITSHFTVPRLLERDMFQERLKQGKTIYVHEFLYPVLQAYDMYEMKVDGQVGGNDQTFNMLAGREYIEEMEKKQTFVLSMKLLADTTGKKMGKSEGNMITLSDTPEDMFGKVMRWTDEMIISAFALCTRIPMAEIRDMETAMDGGENPRDMKLRLASEITSIFLGEKAAQKGQEHFATVIQQHDQPGTIPEFKPSSYDIITVLVEAGFASSKTDARRAIAGGGVKINNTKISSHESSVARGDVVQKGKRFFVKVG